MIEYKLLIGREFLPSAEMRKVKGVTWANQPNHWWFVAYDGERMVACAGLIQQGGTLRFKTDVTIPEYRGKGIYAELSNRRLDFAEKWVAENGQIRKFTCFSSRDSRRQFLKLGFIELRNEDERGVSYMEKSIKVQPKSWG